MYYQLSHAIQQTYPDLLIQGDNCPPPPMRAYAAQILSLAKMAILVLIIAGQDPFTWANMPTPAAWNWAMQNKVGVVVFFLVKLVYICNGRE